MKFAKRSKRFKIHGRWWTVRIGRPPEKEPLNGLCNAETREIYLHPDAIKADGIGIVAHEVAHAVLWPVDEEHVTELGEVISQVAGWVGKASGGTLSHSYGGRV